MAQACNMIEIGGAKVCLFWLKNKIFVKVGHLHLSYEA